MIGKLKLIFVIIASLALFGQANAEVKTEAGYTLKLKASRDGSEYKKGETADFILSVEKDGKPADGVKVHAEMTKDSVVVGRKTSDGFTKDGKFKMSGTLDEAGFLKCKMFAKIPLDGGKFKIVELLAGAAFDPLEIKPSLPAPADFDEFWAQQKKMLAAIPMNLKLTPVKTIKGYKAFDVQADTFGGKLSAYLVYPENAAPKSLPAVVTAHGAGVRSSSLGAALAWAGRGFIALDFNAHGLPNAQPNEYYNKLEKGELKMYATKNCHSRDTIFFRTLFLRVQRTIDVITAQPQWDGKSLLVSGGSQGGGQALAAGGLDSRVSVVLAAFPAICDHSGAAVGRTTGWPHFTRLDANGNYDKQATEAARYVDAVNFAARIKGRVVYMINYADNVCEPTSCYAAYNNIKTPKRLMINEQSRHNPAIGTYQLLMSWAVEEVKKTSPNVHMVPNLKSAW